MNKKIFLSFLIISFSLISTFVQAEEYPFQQQQGYIICLTDLHIGIGDEASKLLVNHIESFNMLPEYIFVGGDLTEMGSDYGYQKLNEYYNSLMQKVPIKWMMGNHDARWTNKAFYLFEKELGKRYFAVNFDKFVFIGLNSATLLEHHGHLGEAQLEWLKNKLVEIGTSKPIIIQLHHPFGGPSQFTDDGYKVFDIIRNYNVPLILYGHGHSYNWFGSYNHSWIQMLGAGLNAYYSPISWDDNNFYLWKAHPEKGVELLKKVPFNREKKEAVNWIKEPVYEEQIISMSVQTKAIKQLNFQFNGEKKVVKVDEDGETIINWKLANPLIGKSLLTVEGIGEGTTLLLSKEIVGDISNIKWSFASGDSMFTQPEVDANYLYFGNQAGTFYKLNKDTGKQVWSYQTNAAIFSSPVFYNDKVIFGSTDMFVYALNRKNGSLCWKTKFPGVIYDGVVAGKKVISIGAGDNMIYGLNPENGEIIWQVYGWGMIQSKGTYYDGKFIFTSWGGVIQLIEEITGKSVQAYCSGSGYATPGVSRPVVYNDRLLYTNTGDRFCSQSLLSKEDCWEKRGLKVGYASVALSDGYGYLSTLKGEIFKFDLKNGKKIWMSNLPQTIYDSSPQCFKKYLAVGTTSGDIVILSQDDGSVKKQISLGNGFIFGKIRATDETLFVGSMDGNLYAIDVNDL